MEPMTDSGGDAPSDETTRVHPSALVTALWYARAAGMDLKGAFEPEVQEGSGGVLGQQRGFFCDRAPSADGYERRRDAWMQARAPDLDHERAVGPVIRCSIGL